MSKKKIRKPKKPANRKKRQYNDQVHELMLEARNGNSDIAMLLADAYRLGDAQLKVSADLEKSIYFYKLAADLGEAAGAHNAFALMWNNDDLFDYESAISYLKKAAELGSKKDQAILDDITANQANGRFDSHYIKYLLAHQKELTDGMDLYHVGMFYKEGMETKQDRTMARYYFEKAVKAGNGGAAYELGSLYQFSRGVEKNIYKAIEYYLKAYEMHINTAASQLAFVYMFEDGVKNEQKAESWIEKALAAHDYNAHSAEFYDLYFIKGDRKKGLLAFDQAIEDGSDTIFNFMWYVFIREDLPDGKLFSYLNQSQYIDLSNNLEIGDCYLLGRGVAADARKAKEAYSRYLDFYDQPELSEMVKYFDPQRPRTSLKKAADQGHQGPAYYLGIMYLYGSFGKKNVDLAFKYLNQSRSDAYQWALGALGHIYLYEKNYQNPELAVSFLTAAAKLNDMQAVRDLYDVYAYGLLGEKDEQKAKEVLRRAFPGYFFQ